MLAVYDDKLAKSAIIVIAVCEDETPLCAHRQHDKTRNTAGPVSLRAFEDAMVKVGLYRHLVNRC